MHMLALASVLAHALAAIQAQTTPPSPTVVTTAVTVVAQKEPADPRGLPLSVTTVSADMLAAIGASSVSEAAIYAPNVFFTEFTARKLSSARVRGIGASPSNPAVTTFIDGVPQLNSNTSSQDLLDIGQIEFVRGPQSALFGRNALGGVVNISSARPSLGAWTGSVSAPLGDHGAREVRANVSGPLGERAAIGLSIGRGERDGFTTNSLTGHRLDFRASTSGKAQLLFTPKDNWELRVIASGERARDGDYALGDLAAIRKTPFTVARDFEGRTDRNIAASTVTLRHVGSSVVFSAATGWINWKTQDVTDLDFTPASLIRRDNTEEATQWTGEARLASAPGAKTTRWQIGASFFTQHYTQDAINTFSPYVLSQFLNFPVTQHSPQSSLDDGGAAVYGQGTIVLDGRLDLSAGARLDYERKKGRLTSFFEPAIAAPSLVNKEKSYTNVSPQVGLSYRLSGDHRIYGSVAMGFKAGGFNPASPAGSEAYDDERTWSGETGIKTIWAGGKVMINAAAFLIDWKRLQLNLPVITSPGQFYIANVGSASSAGFEAELEARPNSEVGLFASLGTTRARFGSGTTSSGVNVSDRLLPNTPSYNAAVGAQWAHQATARVRLFARADVVLTGAFKYDDANTAGQDAYAVTNLRLGVEGKNVSVIGWMRNAFDARYVPVAFAYGPFAPSGFVGEMGRPRTIGVTLTAKF